MKKYLLLLILGIFSIVSYAQEGGQAEYKVELKNLTYNIYRNVKNHTSSHVEIRAYYIDGSYDLMYYSPLGDGSTKNNYNFSVNSTKKVSKIWYDIFVNFSSTSNIGETLNISLSQCPSSSNIFEKAYDGMNMYYKYNVTPIHTLLAEKIPNTSLINSYLPSDDKINLWAKEGFDSSLYHYQYSLDNNNWLDIPTSLYNLNKLTLSAKDILGDTYESYIGQKVYFRVVSCLEEGEYKSKSNSVVLTIYQSAPHILSSSVTKTMCYNSSDGSLAIAFDRDLEPGETLSLQWINTTDNVSDQEDIDALSYEDGKYMYRVKHQLPFGDYELKLMGFKGSFNTYTDGPQHTIKFQIGKYNPVAFSTTKVDVWCKGGYDGQIKIDATGGIPEEVPAAYYEYKLVDESNGGTFSKDWTKFDGDATSQIIKGLPKGTYKIQVRDSNGCVARINGGLGAEKVETIEIKEPDEAFEAVETYRKNPTAFGRADGELTYKVTGGAINSDNTYNFELRESSTSGSLVTTYTTQYDASTKEFYITFKALRGMDYYLSISDKNWTSATDKVDADNDGIGSCGMMSQKITIKQPEPMKAVIEEKQGIFCNDHNQYNSSEDLNNNGVIDEFETGILKVTITGGVPFTTGNNGLPYIYRWKYKAAGSSTFVPVTQAGSSYLTDEIKTLPYGTYSINVEDANGIIMGDYTIVNNGDGTYSYNLTKENDVVYELKQPIPLTVNMAATTVTCSSGANGTAKATVNGGVAPYTYEWSNGATTQEIQNLIAGTYYVYIKDTNGCRVEGQIDVVQPTEVVVEEKVKRDPTCYQGADGEIELNLTGGQAPYTVSWDNGKSGSHITGLKAGKYRVSIKDGSGCTTVKEYELKEPDPIIVDLGSDRTLCSSQQLELNATIDDPAATYHWTKDGATFSTQPSVTLTEAGQYEVTATNAKGCSGSDQILIKKSNETIEPEFLISTQAFVGEHVILVNVSDPKPDQVEWIIPDNVEVVNKTDGYLEVIFPKEGLYELALKGYKGECYDTYEKKVTVQVKQDLPDAAAAPSPFIEEFTIAPVPSPDGNFQVHIKLKEDAMIYLSSYDMLGRIASKPKTDIGRKEYNFTYNISNRGVYIIILETNKERVIRKVVVL